VKRCPQARVDLRIVDLENEMLVYDEQARQVHILNATARWIWLLCDGTHAPEEIAEEVARMYPGTPSETVRQDVEETLETLGAKRLLVWVEEEVPDTAD